MQCEFRMLTEVEFFCCGTEPSFTAPCDAAIVMFSVETERLHCSSGSVGAASIDSPLFGHYLFFVLFFYNLSDKTSWMVDLYLLDTECSTEYR